MPSDVAGVTLFAFATGAPDIFTQLAAINSGEHVDIQLAASSTLGSGLFIICVVLALIVLRADGGALPIQVCCRGGGFRGVGRFVQWTGALQGLRVSGGGQVCAVDMCMS